MRVYITQTENGQEIVNLNYPYDIIEPGKLDGKEIINCEKDNAGDIIIETY